MFIAIFLGVFILAKGPFFDEASRDYSLKNERDKSREASLRDFPSAASKTKLSFVGDIMLARNIDKKMQAEDDYNFVLSKIEPTLKNSDFLFGNLESVISNKGRDIGSKYSFRAHPKTIKTLKQARFDLVSVANNHSADWASKAFLDGLNRLKSEDISPCGGGKSQQQAYRPVIKTINGFKIATFCTTNIGPKLFEAKNDNPGFAWLRKDTLLSKISKLKKKKEVDLIIASYHFGEEYEKEPSPRQKKLARSTIEAGADLVIGHHPHVTQPIESYKDGLIAYSLGNFVFDQLFSKATRESFIFNVYLDQHGTVSSYEKQKIKINDNYQPELVEQKEKTRN